MMEGGPDTETRNTKLIVQLCKLILFVSSVAKEASERASKREKKRLTRWYWKWKLFDEMYFENGIEH